MSAAALDHEVVIAGSGFSGIGAAVATFLSRGA